MDATSVSVSAEIEKGLAGKKWPEGYTVTMRGEVSSMRESFQGLAFGFLLAVVLIYFVMVPLFRSFRDPLIVMLAVPLGLIGVIAMLFMTGTTLNIQSFMGTIFMVGIAQSNKHLARRVRQSPAGAREACSRSRRRSRSNPVASYPDDCRRGTVGIGAGGSETQRMRARRWRVR